MEGISGYRGWLWLAINRRGRRLGKGGHGEWISGGSFVRGKVLDGGLVQRSWSGRCKRIGLHGGIDVGPAIGLLLLLNW